MFWRRGESVSSRVFCIRRELATIYSRGQTAAIYGGGISGPRRVVFLLLESPCGDSAVAEDPRPSARSAATWCPRRERWTFLTCFDVSVDQERVPARLIVADRSSRRRGTRRARRPRLMAGRTRGHHAAARFSALGAGWTMHSSPRQHVALRVGFIQRPRSRGTASTGHTADCRSTARQVSYRFAGKPGSGGAGGPRERDRCAVPSPDGSVDVSRSSLKGSALDDDPTTLELRGARGRRALRLGGCARVSGSTRRVSV